MYDVFQQYLDGKISLTSEEASSIRECAIIKRIRKRQYLLQEGDVWRYDAFIAKGCLRTYSIDEAGIEHIIGFGIENWWIGDRESLLSGQPSRFNIDAVEDSEVILFTHANFEQLCMTIPAFGQLINQILQRSFIASQNRIQAALSYTAEEKYRAFLDKYFAFANRLPQNMIASYLGITPETLSRVRKNASKKS
ncbi:Crp/Fnr family transcriptional regulator [Paraflavitalea pollutisoli]|uniref:Crp/Fnr family transcriptional regulator n=1 Tax=Paraflavitalea pollutisoli TaxID=3034143 RepID=UPI0023EC349B|nr:Crp/Fnr family transcriptional regulator [Paraflavitalea sp. H1-2-19X]